MNKNVGNSTHQKDGSNVVPLTGGESGVVKNATVLTVAGRSLTLKLKTNNGGVVTVEARLAYSCLVAPQIADTVLCVQNETKMHIVLAILDRPSGSENSQDMIMEFPANATIQCPSGNLDILAKQKASVIAGDTIVCAANKTVHKSTEAIINYHNITAQANRLTGKLNSVHIISDMVTTIAKQAFQKFTHYTRSSSKTDHVKAVQMDRKIEGLFTMKSKTTIMISEQDTKVDGERIHMG